MRIVTRIILIFIYVLILLTMHAYGSQPKEERKELLAQERITKFQHEIEIAARRIGLKNIFFKVTERNPQEEIQASTNTQYAYTHSGEKLNDMQVYIIELSASLLSDPRPYIMLEHLALHEACHIKNGDIEAEPLTNRPKDPHAALKQIEGLAEYCVITTVGEKKYSEFSDYAWRNKLEK